jgi:hypothetical protein
MQHETAQAPENVMMAKREETSVCQRQEACENY